MGVVYLATQAFPERKVALKLLASDLASDPAFRERFARESNAAASTEHPNIVPVYGAGEGDGQLYLAMRYVEGTDLRALLEREGPLDPKRAAHICAQIAEALEAAHERGLIHRDVKPGNVLLDSHERAYLTDFGLIRRTRVDTEITRTGQFMGTIDYVAPEQIKGSELDGRADVYSLGCVLYECLTGDPPFGRDSEVATMYAHLEESPPRPSAKAPDIPDSLDAVVTKAMAMRPEDRFATAGEMANALRVAAVHREARGRVQSRSAVIVVAILALLAGALGIILMRYVTEERANARDGTAAAAPPLESAVSVDPDTGLIMTIVPGLSAPLKNRPTQTRIEVALGSIWVLNGDQISEIDPTPGEIVSEFEVSGFGSFATLGFATFRVDFRTIWLDRGLAPEFELIGRLDPTSGETLPEVKLPVGPHFVGAGTLDFDTGERAVWASYAETVWRVDPQTGDIAASIELPSAADAIAAGSGYVWTTDELAGSLTRIDPTRNEIVDTIEIGGNVDDVVAGEGAAWILDTLTGTITQVNASTGAVGRAVRVGPTPTAYAAGLGAVWVTDEDGSLYRVDTTTLEVTRIEVGRPLSDVAVDEKSGTIWVSVSKVVQQS